MIRQGDILLVPTSIDFEGFKLFEEKIDEDEGIIVAEGEATGHHHRIRTPGVRRVRSGGHDLIHVPAGTTAELTHEEHQVLPIHSGTYRVMRQKEYVPPREQTVSSSRLVFD